MGGRDARIVEALPVIGHSRRLSANHRTMASYEGGRAANYVPGVLRPKEF
jgi:hypothetical protein